MLITASSKPPQFLIATHSKHLDITSHVRSSTIFSKLDLQMGYYQVPVGQEDIQNSYFGMFE